MPDPDQWQTVPNPNAAGPSDPGWLVRDASGWPIALVWRPADADRIAAAGRPVVVRVSGGVVQSVTGPPGYRVLVRDYDDGAQRDDPDGTDDGGPFQEQLFAD